MAELSLSASWEDVSASTGSLAPSTSLSLSSSAVGASLAGKATPVPLSTIGKATRPTFSTSTSVSPFASRVPQPSFGHQAPPTPKFTAFGSPIPSATGVSTGRGVITERAKTLFSTSAVGGPSADAKSATRVSLFDTAGSAKNAQNAFYKPPSALAARTSLDVGGVPATSSTAKNTVHDSNTAKQNGKTEGGDSDGEDVSMGSGSDVEIIEEDRRDESGGEEQEEEAATDEDEDDAGNFLTYDKSGAADLTLHTHHVDEMMDEDHGTGPVLGFSVFSGSRNAVQNGGQGKNGVSGSEHALHVSPPRRARVSPSREGDKSLSTSIGSTTTNRSRAPPGAFHPEEDDDDDDRHDENENKDDTEEEGEEDDHASQTTPIQSPRRSTRTRRQSETPSRPSARSKPQRSTKSTATTTDGTNRPSTRSGRTSSRLNLRHSIPGSLVDEDDDEHGQDDADHTDTYGDEDTEMDEQEEEDDAIAPLPSRSSRRTRSSGFFGTSTKSKSSAKPTAPAKTTATATATKGKARARPPEAKTPARRSSRLSMASSTSPDASPTKGRKSTDSRAPIAGNSSGTVATRSNARRKR